MTNMTHNVKLDNESDPVENMLKKTGCIELHYKVQECIASKQDWRKCQNEVNEFRICMSTTKMVMVVRTDLKMSTGKIASQCAHAAITLYDLSLKENNNCLNIWLRTGQPKIVLKVECEQTLRTMFDVARKNGLCACLIHDAGRTQLESGSLTVLGIGPNLIQDVDKITCHLKLL